MIKEPEFDAFADLSDAKVRIRALWAILGPNEQLDLPTACHLATCDGRYYEELKRRAIEERNNLSDVQKVMIFDALMRKPPRKGKGKHVHRNYKISVISQVLRTEFKLKWEDVDDLLIKELPIHIDLEALRSLRKVKS